MLIQVQNTKAIYWHSGFATS